MKKKSILLSFTLLLSALQLSCDGNILTSLESSESDQIFNDGSGVNDVTPPGVPSNIGWLSGDNQIENNSGLGSTIQLLFTQPSDNDIVSIEYVITANSVNTAPSSGWVTTESLSTQTLQYSAARECSSPTDMYKIWLRAVDSNNNRSNAVQSPSFIQDTVAPSVGVLMLAEDAQKTKSPTVSWTLANDACSSVTSLEFSIGTGLVQTPPNHDQSGEVADTLAFASISTGITSYQAESDVAPFSTIDLLLATQYYVSLRLTDSLGNTNIVTSAAWELSEGPLSFSDTPPQFWLDGQDIETLKQDLACSTDVVSNGDAINCWVNKGTDGSNFLKDTGEAVYKSTAPVGVTFDGDIFVAQNVFSGLLDDVLVIIVQTENSSTSSFDFNLNHPFTGAATSTATSRYSIHAPWSDRRFYWDTGGCCGSAVRLNSNAGEINVGETHILGFLNSSGQDSKQIIVDGDSVAQSSNDNAGFAEDFALGSGVRNTYHEIIFYTPAPTFAERQDIEGYIACKWDLRHQMPVSHPYYNADGTSEDGCP